MEVGNAVRPEGRHSGDRRRNRDAVRLYDLDDGKDFENARRNLISARTARLCSILRCTPISAMTRSRPGFATGLQPMVGHPACSTSAECRGSMPPATFRCTRTALRRHPGRAVRLPVRGSGYIYAPLGERSPQPVDPINGSSGLHRASYGLLLLRGRVEVLHCLV
jgi:hypothetical protein